MSTEQKQPGNSRWLMPLWIALPLLAVLLFAALFLGPYVMRFINVAIKAVVMA